MEPTPINRKPLKLSAATNLKFQETDTVESVSVTPIATLKRAMFNLNQALNGVSVGFFLDGELVPVMNFSEHDLTIPSMAYKGSVNGVTYYFNSLGGCSDKDQSHTLQMLNVDIPVKRDTAGTRGEEGTSESIMIASLQPREQFAMAAMQSIINKIDTPILLLDGYKITQITTLSFLIANSMMNLAASYRKETDNTNNPVETVEVEESSLSTISEKLMYNITSYLGKLSENFEKYKKLVEDEAKNTKNISIESVNEDIVFNSKITNDINIGNTVDVNVISMPKSEDNSEEIS